MVATPGALYRYWWQKQTGGGLALVLIAGTLPGVVAGSIIPVELLPGLKVFDLVIAAVLFPLVRELAISVGRPRHVHSLRQLRGIPRERLTPACGGDTTFQRCIDESRCYP